MARPVAARGGTRTLILRTAGRLFAERGYHGTSITELGAAAGISGPGLYKHFPNKEALLGELLVGCSRRLLDGATARTSGAAEDAEMLRALVEFHIAFALDEPELIVVQDRDWAQLSETDQRAVRRLQRAYVEVWRAVLARLRPDLDGERARATVQAVFGLMNSTPHSVGGLSRTRMSGLLRDLALAAFLAPARAPARRSPPRLAPAGEDGGHGQGRVGPADVHQEGRTSGTGSVDAEGRPR